MPNISLMKILTPSVTGVALLMTVNFVFPTASFARTRSQSYSEETSYLNTNYQLGGGDLIKVNVFEVPEYSGEYQIPPGGAINLPLIGSVNIQGLTTEQAADEIATKYAFYLKRPIISVNLISPRPINIFVAGEVTRPGSYTLSLQGGAGNNPGVQYPTVLSALTTAQGVMPTGDITRVEVRRRLGRNSQQTVIIDLNQLLQNGNSAQDLTLRDGDTIIVRKVANFNLAQARNLSAASFAASTTTPRTVAIIGEVYRPGSYLVSAGTDAGSGSSGTTSGSGLPTVMRAIQLAGGITPQANVRNVIIRRPTRTSGEQDINVNLWQLLQSGDINQDALLQDGDTVVIPTATEVNPSEATQLATTTLSPTNIQVGVVGEVKKPGPAVLQPNSSLNQALLAAGGFNDARASHEAVDLIRLNPDGSVTKRKVKVNFASGINEKDNPILRNNDVIVVYRSGAAKAGDTISTIINPFASVLGVFRALFGY